MEKHSTPLMVLETRRSSTRPATSSALTSTRSPIWAAMAVQACVVKAASVALYTGTAMPFAGLVSGRSNGIVDGAVTPRVRNNPSGTPTCDPPV